ncbi:MAG: alpha/beta fold hydrolase [Halioglobus sp.]
MLKRIVKFLLVFPIVVLVVLLLLRNYLQMQVEQDAHIDTPNGIESLEQVTINGDQQWIYLRGHDQNNPVLLYLHGGPGMAELPTARAFGTEIEKSVTVVHWDQRGSGKSRDGRAKPENLTIQTYLDDVLALTHQLRERFGKEKIYLVGHSWGSLLGALTVRDNPELYHAYVGIGQIANMYDNERVSLAFAQAEAAKRGNADAQQALADIDINTYSHDLAQMTVQRTWLYAFGGGIRLSAMQDLILAYVTSPEYTLLDLWRLLQGSDALPARLWAEVMPYDLLRQAPEFQIPIYFFAGENDYNTPSELAAAYLESLGAPHKELVWFEGAAHLLNFSSSEEYQRALLDKVLVWH